MLSPGPIAGRWEARLREQGAASWLWYFGRTVGVREHLEWRWGDSWQ